MLVQMQPTSEPRTSWAQPWQGASPSVFLLLDFPAQTCSVFTSLVVWRGGQGRAEPWAWRWIRPGRWKAGSEQAVATLPALGLRLCGRADCTS